MPASLSDGDPENENRLNVVLADYLKRRDAGESVNRDELLKAHPDFEQELQSWFQGEVMLEEGIVPAADSKRRVPPNGSEICDTLRPGGLESDTASEFNARRFGRYQLLRPLGEGAMGTVYLARDTILDRQVALKMPKTQGTDNTEFMLRFAREAKAAAALNHENICRVYDAGEQDGVAFITMDYIDGVPLSQFIASSRLNSLDSILKITTTIAHAVHHAHNNGVVHRDLKPGNILVDAELKPVVTDFGLARREGAGDESRITQEGLLLGTPAYMAPEQIKGEQAKVGPRSDVYSLGVILFELLTARLPFEGRVPELLAKSLRDATPIPSRIRRDLSEDVDDLCLRMLKKDPDKRFASMEEVATAIQKLNQKIAASDGPSGHEDESENSPFENQKSHIEVMLKNGQYAEATHDHLQQLAKETGPAVRAVADWAKKKLPAVRKESKALSPTGLQALMKTAVQMYKHHDYPGCIQLLEEIPTLRRTDAMEGLLTRATEIELKAERFLMEIKSRERRQEVSGLEPMVRKFLKLKPGNKYAKRLQEALQTYGKASVSARTYHFERGRLKQMPEPSLLRKWLLLSSLVGIAVFLTVYSYTIFYLKSGSQLLAVHVDDNWLRNQGGKLTLLVDGDQHAISTAPKDSAPMTVEVTFGKHTFSVTHGDVVVHDPQTFEISKNGRRILSITPVEMQLLHNRPVSGTADGDVVAGTEMPDEPPDQSRTTAEAAALKNASEVTVANSTVNNSAPGSRSEIREHRPEAAPHALAQTQSQNADDGSGINSSLKLISQVHGATEKQLNRWTQTLPDGYRPYWISLRAAGPEIRFDALARTAPMQTECVLEHYVAGNTADDRRYEKRWGPFRPAIDNVYEEAGSMKRQVLWGKDGPHWKKHFGDEVQIKEKITAGFHNVNADTSQPEHFIPTNLSARYFGESVNYELAQAYGPYTEGEFLPNLTMAEIASKIKGYHKKRWRLHLLAGIRNAPDSRYCVVFVKNGSTFRKWAVSPRLTVAQYEELLQKIDARGGWPRCVASTIEDGNIVYSVLWDEITQQGLKSISIVSDPNSPMTRPEDF